MIKIAQEGEEGRVRMIVKTSMESPQIIVTDGDDLKVFFHIFGFFMRECDKTTTYQDKAKEKDGNKKVADKKISEYNSRDR